MKFFYQHISNWKEKEDTNRRSIQVFLNTQMEKEAHSKLLAKKDKLD
jgi:hypothetical protein